MDIFEEILALRDCGRVRCGSVRTGFESVVQVAEHYELSVNPETYHEIDEEKARAVTLRILAGDLAYDSWLLSSSEAEDLVERFFRHFCSETPKYFTNGTYYENKASISKNATRGPSWMPATEATFDTGVLVVGESESGCVWVEDED